MGRVAYPSVLFAAVSAALVLPATRAAGAEAPPAAVVAAVEKVCLPLIGGQPVASVAPAAGLERRGEDWTLKMNGGSIRVSPPSAANPSVCIDNVAYERANGEAILDALGKWATARGLKPVKAGVPSKGADLQYKTSSWSGSSGGKTTTVVFTEQTELDGRPTGGQLDEAVLLVSVAG